jgi:lysophospholipase L1-like esterase
MGFEPEGPAPSLIGWPRLKFSMVGFEMCTPLKRSVYTAVLGTLLIGSSARGQLLDEFSPPRSNCCLANTARNLAEQLQDWNQLGRYHQANQELKRQPADPRRVVFMGDSITDFWKLDEYFPGKPYVDRGISGQTTPQMLVRMYPDVIELKPVAMVVLAGINDVSHNTGPSTAEMIEQNIMAMTELAQHHGIKVILCSLLPVSDYPYSKQQAGRGPQGQPATTGPAPGPFPRIKMTEGHPPADILKLNAWLKDYANRVNATYADYFTALVDEKGWLKDGYSADGLHPNVDGYKVMAPIAAAAIQQAIQ